MAPTLRGSRVFEKGFNRDNKRMEIQMVGDLGTFFSTDTLSKIVFLLIAALIGFISSYSLDKIKRHREPRRRISYDLALGTGMASVPTELTEKVAVTFGGQRIEGQLFEVRARVSNSGNQVVKNQFLRFSFPVGSTILDTYLINEVRPEFGIEEAPLENQNARDHRWLLGHLEKGEFAEFGMLVAAREAAPPEVIGHNEEGGVELKSVAAAAREDDATHVEPFLYYTALSIFVPPIVSALPLGGTVENALEISLRLFLLLFLMPHVTAIGRLIAKRVASKPQDAGVVPLQIYNNESGQVFVSTGSSTMKPNVADRRDDH